MAFYYTIYDAKTDELLAAGTAEECTGKLGISSLNSFYSMVSRAGQFNKYVVHKQPLREPEETDVTRLEVLTPFGILAAVVTGDLAHPAIRLCLEQSRAGGHTVQRELARIGVDHDVPAPGWDCLRLLIWQDEHDDDFTQDIAFEEERRHG